jgi:hypothetical protein
MLDVIGDADAVEDVGSEEASAGTGAVFGQVGEHWFDDIATVAQRITFIGSLDG